MEAAIGSPLRSDMPDIAAELSTAISLSLSIEIPSHPSPSTSPLTLEVLSPVLKSPQHSSGSALGNLFMSSCPGKKVRLNGPVGGRSSVSRDLDMDMARMKSLGVGCLIWWVISFTTLDPTGPTPPIVV